MNEQTLFIEALARENPAERAAFLEEACAGDPALRARIERLLERHQQAGSFLEQPPGVLEGTGLFTPVPEVGAQAVGEGPGTVIGPYKLVEEIGAGGMGTVYLAQQTAPVKRLVALKVIKPGMDSRQVIARFEAERQALALMDHPNIARVLDAGTTEGGRPYFVMELVKGAPLTRYCDEQRLSPRQRLELFVPVCQAVQHAHQKGIIHRDLKPSNILVAQYDGKPVPKVIDFGIAKATGQQLTEHTLVTGFGAVVGTLEYMSPEQAELNQLDVDTRSDVYALGVVLYELLTGSTPLERRRLKRAAMLEVLRLIREEEPPRPSMRLSSTDELPSIAAARGIEPRKLSGLVRGELDWVVMKALEKDRSRRYETANGLALDIQRYLADEPVAACPPSAIYRLRKLARRNKRALAALALVLLALVLGTAISAWQAVLATRARDDEIAARAAEREAQDALDAARDERERQRTDTNRDLSKALADATELRGKARATRPGEEEPWDQLRGVVRRAEALASSPLADPTLAGRLQALLKEVQQEEADRRMTARLEEIHFHGRGDSWLTPFLFRGVMNDNSWEVAFREYGLPVLEGDAAEAARRVAAAPIRDWLVAALDSWAGWQVAANLDGGRPQRLLAVARLAVNDPWRRSYLDARIRNDIPVLLRLVRDPGALDQPPAILCMLAANARMYPHMHSDAIELLRSAQVRYPADVLVNFSLAGFARRSGNVQESLAYYRAALGARPNSWDLHMHLGTALSECGRHVEAVAVLRRAVALAPAVDRQNAYVQLAGALTAKGEHDGALATFRQALETGPSTMELAYRLCQTFLLLRGRVSWEEAAATFRQFIARNPMDERGYLFLGRALLHTTVDTPAADAAALRKSLELYPRASVIQVPLVRALLDAGDPDGAVSACRRAIALAPPPPPAYDPHGQLHFLLAGILRARGDWDGAVDAYRRAIACEERVTSIPSWQDFCRAYLGLGRALLHQKDDTSGDLVAACRKALVLYPQSPRAHYALGQALRAKGDRAGARDAFRKASKLDPGDGLRKALLAALRDEGAAENPSSPEALRARGDLDGAIKAYRKAVELSSGSVRGYPLLAEALRLKGDWDGAVAVYCTAIELAPEFGDLYLGLGRALLHEKDDRSNDAIAAYRKALELYPRSTEIYRKLAALLWGRDKEGAIAAYRKVIELDPRSPTGYDQLALCLSFKGDQEGIIAAYRKLIEANPKCPSGYPKLANALRARGDWEGALDAYRKSCEVDPLNAPAYLLVVAGRLREKGDRKGAIDACRKATEVAKSLDVNVVSAYRAWALALDDDGDRDGGIAIRRKGIEVVSRQALPELKSSLASLYMDLAMAVEAKGDREGAAAARRKVIDLDPEILAQEQIRLGNALLSKQDLKGAIAACRRAIETAPKYADGHSSLGRALEIKGERDGALVAYRKAIELNPREADAYLGVARTLKQKGDLKGALAALDKAIEQMPPYGVIYRNKRASLLFGLRRWDEALGEYSRAIDDNPSNFTLWYDRGLIHAILGRMEKACGDYSQCLKLNPGCTLARVRLASVLLRLKRYPEALAAYRSLLEAAPPSDPSPFNDMAWLLATCPDDKLRDPKRAVELARKAVELWPKEGIYHNTLGVACYYRGDFQAAVAALEEAMQLRKGGDAFNWLFLAMAHARLGHRDEARKWYDRAVQWQESNKEALARDPLHDEEVRRFRKEAEEVLDLKKK